MTNSGGAVIRPPMHPLTNCQPAFRSTHQTLYSIQTLKISKLQDTRFSIHSASISSCYCTVRATVRALTIAPPRPATMSLAAASLACLSASSLSWYLAAVASAWANTLSIDFNMSPVSVKVTVTERVSVRKRGEVAERSKEWQVRAGKVILRKSGGTVGSGEGWQKGRQKGCPERWVRACEERERECRSIL